MTLDLDTPIDEAARLMQRYGYEGFPVMDGYSIAGLLTRRNVDRAIAHKLQVKVSEIMDSGSVWVQPGDSMHTLQKVMAETGWGQVPVFDPEKNKIVGIVTRTDLLRILTNEGKPAEWRRNLGGELDAYLPGATISLLKLIAVKERIWVTRFTWLEVSSATCCLNVLVLIWISSWKGMPFAWQGRSLRNYGGRQVSHSRFGTAKWFIRDIHDYLHRLPGFSH